MKLMDKYLLRQHLVPLAYCLIAFSMIFVINDLFDHLSQFMEADTPAPLIALYYLCFLAPTLEIIMPASLLLATLYALWQLARNNELTAMWAGGIGFIRVMLPFLAVGLFFSLVSAVIKEVAEPRANQWADDFRKNKFVQVDHNYRMNQLYFNNVGRRQWAIGKFDLKHPNLLYDVEIRQERPEGSWISKTTADKAEWADGQWWCRNVRVQKFDENDNPIGLASPPQPLKEMPGLDEKPSDFVHEANGWRYLTTMELNRRRRLYPDISRHVDFHSRLAMPWICLIATIFAIPMGAGNARKSALTGVFLALSLLLGFYGLMRIGVFCAKKQMLPPIVGAWLSNIVFLAIGAALIKRRK